MSGAAGEPTGSSGRDSGGRLGASGASAGVGSGAASAGTGNGGAPSGGGTAGKESGGIGSETASGGAGGSGAQQATGGDSALGNLPLPADCRALRGAATELLCSLDVDCRASAQTMRCYYGASRGWQCTCEPPNTNTTYLIDGAEGLDACAVGAALCAGAVPTPPLDVSTCVLSREESGDSRNLPTCTAEMQCEWGVPVDFAPGVRVTMPGVGVVDCLETAGQPRASSPESPMRVDCSTAGSLGSQSYTLVANGVLSACRPVLEFYLGANEAKFEGEKTCISQSDEDTFPDSCRISEDCFDSAPLSSGVNFVRGPASNRIASCGFDDLGGLSCGCSIGSGAAHVSLGYELGPAPRPATCDLSDCTAEMRAEPTGPGDCQWHPDPSMDDEDSCLAYFGCTQPATLAGQAVKLYSQLNARCARAAGGPFYCGCAAGEQTARFRLDDVASSLEACKTAGTACLEHLTLPLGPAPTAGPVADPLLGP